MLVNLRTGKGVHLPQTPRWGRMGGHRAGNALWHPYPRSTHQGRCLMYMHAHTRQHSWTHLHMHLHTSTHICSHMHPYTFTPTHLNTMHTYLHSDTNYTPPHRHNTHMLTDMDSQVTHMQTHTVHSNGPSGHSRDGSPCLARRPPGLVPKHCRGGVWPSNRTEQAEKPIFQATCILPQRKRPKARECGDLGLGSGCPHHLLFSLPELPPAAQRGLVPHLFTTALGCSQQHAGMT